MSTSDIIILAGVGFSYLSFTVVVIWGAGKFFKTVEHLEKVVERLDTTVGRLDTRVTVLEDRHDRVLE